MKGKSSKKNIVDCEDLTFEQEDDFVIISKTQNSKEIKPKLFQIINQDSPKMKTTIFTNKLFERNNSNDIIERKNIKRIFTKKQNEFFNQENNNINLINKNNIDDIEQIKDFRADCILYDKNKQLERIRTEKAKYEELNNGIISKINEVAQAIEAQRERQIAHLRRREMMMNYLMTMLLGLRQRSELDYPNVDNMSYEELLALEERMGNVNKGLSQEKLDKIPTQKFSRYKFTDDKCIICQYEFQSNEKVKVLPCKHCFHPDCIDEWLKNQKACPYCKTEVKI